MNRCKIFSIVAVFSISPMALAAGTHSSGHDDSENHSKMKNMDQSMMKSMGHWMAPKAESARKNPVKISDKSLLAGQKLFQNSCVSCHGAKGEGDGVAGAFMNPKPANLRAMADAHPDGDFAYKIKTGRGTMPGWKNTFSNTEVWHLVNYIKSMGKGSVAVNDEETGHKHADGEGHGS